MAIPLINCKVDITKEKEVNMVLHHYQSNSGKDLILEYVKSLPADEKKDKKKIKKDKKIVIK